MASKLGLASLAIALTLETRLVEAVTLATCLLDALAKGALASGVLLFESLPLCSRATSARLPCSEMPPNSSVCAGSDRDDAEVDRTTTQVWSVDYPDDGMRDERGDVRQCALVQSPALLSAEERQVDHDAWCWPWLCRWGCGCRRRRQ